MTRRLACAAVSAAHDEPLHGWAPPCVRGWLLLEHPGPWPKDAPHGVLDNHLVAALDARTTDRGLRLQLIRRPDRRAPRRLACYLIRSYPGGPWAERRLLGDHVEALDADLDAVAHREPPGWGAPVTEPFLAVCTHGKKDACCAEFGRPVLRALSVALDGRVWEISHVGGDRFAANVLGFPHGLCFGRVRPHTALRIANAYLDGRIDLDHYRGRAGVPQAASAADCFVRRQEGLDGLDDTSLEDCEPVADGAARVVLTAGDHRYEVTVRLEPHGQPRPGGCGHDALVTPSAWTLVREVRESRTADHGLPVASERRATAPTTRRN